MALEHIPLTDMEYFGTKEGLTYEEELTLIAERFEMTKEEVLKTVVHAVYITGVYRSVLREAIEIGFSKLLDDECIMMSRVFNCDGSLAEEDEEDEEDDEEDDDVPF